MHRAFNKDRTRPFVQWLLLGIMHLYTAPISAPGNDQASVNEIPQPRTKDSDGPFLLPSANDVKQESRARLSCFLVLGSEVHFIVRRADVH